MEGAITVMDWNEASKIVEEYGAILEKRGESGRPGFPPISVLPYSKEEIKTAIKLCYFFTTMAGTITEEWRNAAEGCYIYLADFIDDDKAKKANSC